MNLYSSSSICENCGKQAKLLVLIDDYRKLVGGKKFLNVDLFELI